jgi:hypothetical protein
MQDNAMNTYFVLNNYGSVDVIDNLGSTGVFICFFILAHAISLLLRVCPQNRLARYLHGTLYWNSSIRFLIQQYVPIVLACLINMQFVRKSWFNFIDCF